MPLETFTGPAIRPLLARAEAEFGPEAVMFPVRRVDRWDGSAAFELVAGDPQSAAAGGNGVGNAPELTAAAPAPASLVRDRRAARPALVAIVGPTGAGKTTTVAKLMGNRGLFGTYRTGLMSFDTYRIGAVEQLRTYAEIGHAPMQVVYAEREVVPALRRLSHCEVVLLDTPGWGPRNAVSRDVVQAWLRRIRPDEVHLAIPVATPRPRAEALIADYAGLGVTHLLPTKLDEASEEWTLFDLAAERYLPMRWLTDGQEVPFDLRPARPRLLAARAGRKRHLTSAEAAR